jgi:hypothetical protein
MARWTYRQAWACLMGSTLATLALSMGGYTLWHRWQLSRQVDEQYKIVAIVQTGPEREALQTTFLAELLHLSVDQSTSLYAFDVQRAERTLLDCPLIYQASIKRVPPGTLYIDYTIRKPLAWLADYQNCGLDKDGCFFPLSPFYSPKNLPEIYLGLPPFDVNDPQHGRLGGVWRISSQDKYLLLAFDILRMLHEAPWREGMRLKRIDVSNAFASSAGQREIVLLTEDELILRENEIETVCIFPKILRLPSKDYVQQLSNFLTLRRTMIEDYRRQIKKSQFGVSPVQFAPRIVDLRIPKMALVQNN